MNRVMHACGLESRPRWIELENLGHKYYRAMCSSCGEIINKRVRPAVCPHCREEMKTSREPGKNYSRETRG